MVRKRPKAIVLLTIYSEFQRVGLWPLVMMAFIVQYLHTEVTCYQVSGKNRKHHKLILGVFVFTVRGSEATSVRVILVWSPTDTISLYTKTHTYAGSLRVHNDIIVFAHHCLF